MAIYAISAEWLAYICAVITPFVQEDAAVLLAASTSAMGVVNPVMIFIAVTIGLVMSDLWKYWLGRAAITQGWAKKHAESPRIAKAKDGIVNNLGKSLLIARFLPGARIPLYIAAGFFKASFLKFAMFIMLSAVIYISLAFGLFYLLGEVAGEKAKAFLPIIAITVFASIMLFKTIKKRRQKTVP